MCVCVVWVGGWVWVGVWGGGGRGALPDICEAARPKHTQTGPAPHHPWGSVQPGAALASSPAQAARMHTWRMDPVACSHSLKCACMAAISSFFLPSSRSACECVGGER